MPELTQIGEGTVFSVRTFKRVGNLVWANTYELVYDSATPPQSPSSYLEAIGGIIADAEVAIHNQFVTLDRVVISSIERDSTPYNPYTFVVIPKNLTCTGSTGTRTPLPLTICVLVKKKVLFGRSGNILYRGALVTDSGVMTQEGFKIGLGDKSRIETSLNSMLTNLEAFDTALALVKLSDTGAVEDVRKVTEVEVRELTTSKKLYNRYYDVASNGGGYS